MFWCDKHNSNLFCHLQQIFPFDENTTRNLIIMAIGVSATAAIHIDILTTQNLDISWNVTAAIN